MEEIPYIRAGTTYYKMVMSPTVNGDFNLKWSKRLDSVPSTKQK